MTGREIAHALNNVTAVIISTVELLGKASSSALDNSLLKLLEHAAREVEELSSRVVGLAATTTPPAESANPVAAPIEPPPAPPAPQSAPAVRESRQLSIDELVESLAARKLSPGSPTPA